MKFKIGVLIFVLALAMATVITLVSGGIVADAYTSEDISIKFFNNSIEITPTKNATGYEIEYIPDMIITISGSIPGDPDANSGVTIKQNGETRNAIYKAGTYEVTVHVTPSNGGSFVYKTFKFQVHKKELTDLVFTAESVNIIYLDEVAPKLLLDEVVALNTKTTFKYYTDSTLRTEIAPPINAGNYYVEATVEGDNYIGKVSSEFIISKSNAFISILNDSPVIKYDKAQAGYSGYNILNLLGAEVTNTENPQKHTLKTYIKKDEEYVEQSSILIPNIYEYKVVFANGDNYDYTQKEGTIVLNKGDVQFGFGGNIDVRYSLDIDVVGAIKNRYNFDGGFWIVNSETEAHVLEINENLINITFFDLDGNQLETIPSEVGNYYIQFAFIGNDYYNQCVSEKIEFKILKRDISNEITTFGEQNFAYGVEYSVENKFKVSEEYTAIPIISYKKINSNNELLENLTEKPTNPGRYAAVFEIESDNYYGTKTLVFTISKLLIPQESITVDNLEYVYGDTLNISVTVDSAYNVTNDNVKFTYKIFNGDKLDKAPVYAGNYQVIVTIETDIHQAEVVKDLTISKKDLNIKAKAREVIYGNALFTLDAEKHYLQEDFVFDGLVKDADKASVLANVTVYVGENEYTTNNLNMVVGTYKMKIHGTHSNYNIIDAGCDDLTVVKRVLTVKTNTIKQYVGFNYTPVISVENSVYNDRAENMVLLFEVYYLSENDEVLQSAPTTAGSYKIAVRVKPENVDCSELKNYTLNFVPSTLTLMSNQKNDKDKLIVLEGKFDASTELVVKTINANESVENAIKAVDKKYEIEKLYFIQYTFNTVDHSAFTLRLSRKDIDVSNAKVMIGYSADSFEEVDYTVDGDYLVLRLQTMPSYYAICVQHNFPLVWIIVIVVAGVIVLAGVGVFLFIYFTGANVKARKNDVSLSSAVTAKAGLKTEDEEFDELLENFDESTVVKEEDPAERIKRQKEQEIREQYRLYLRRMRASTDKNTSDRLKQLGVDADFDEEQAIDQLIEEDNRKRQQREAEEARLRAEAQKQKQKETSFTINERKSGTLSSTSSPIKPKKNIDDDDIDF